MQLQGSAPAVLKMVGHKPIFSARWPPACGCRLQRSVRTRAAKGFGKLLEKNKKVDKQAGKLRRLTPHQVSPRLRVPGNIQKPPYVDTGEMPWGKEPAIHSAEGVSKMRAACKLAAEVLSYAGSFVKPGVTTDFIDKKVHEMIIDNSAYPSPLTYGNFPKSVCTSVNECVCHGIPDSRELQEGDIVNIDVTVYLNGYHGDTSRTCFVGEPSQRARWLCEINRESLDEAIKLCGPGVPFNSVGKVIEDIADRHKVKVISDFVGHGVGRSFHCEPPVFPTRNGNREVMRSNQTFTIEPIFVDGSTRWQTWRDGWTIVTKDGSWTAQHEHTILITDHGHEVLTQL